MIDAFSFLTSAHRVLGRLPKLLFSAPSNAYQAGSESYLTVPAELHCVARTTLHYDKVSVWVNYKVK